MNTQKEVTKWERENKDVIIRWESAWDIKPDVKVITFEYKDIDNKIQEKVFEIPV